MLSLCCLSVFLTLGLFAERARRALSGTTLTVAAGWTLAGSLLGLLSAAFDLYDQQSHRGWSDSLWHLTAVMLLCPGIAVLGARRPGAFAWTFFVLIPLLLVLLWPVVSSRRVITAGVPLELEAPGMLGFLLVLVMSAGNYFGTRHTLSSLLYTVGLLMLVGPGSSMLSGILPVPAQSRMLGSLALLASMVIAVRNSAAVNVSSPIRECEVPVEPPSNGSAGAAPFRPLAPASDDVSSNPEHAATSALSAVVLCPGMEPFDRVWRDFFDAYGIVWPKRVLERINAAARHEKWPVRLDWFGFVLQPGRTAEEAATVRPRLEQTLRWVLKRFVDPDWIDRRLQPQSHIQSHAASEGVAET